MYQFALMHYITFRYDKHRDSVFKEITSFLCVLTATKKLPHKFALNFCATLLSCHSFQTLLASHAHHHNCDTTIIKGVVRIYKSNIFCDSFLNFKINLTWQYRKKYQLEIYVSIKEENPINLFTAIFISD